MVFQCINIRQVPWEVLKTAAFGSVECYIVYVERGQNCRICNINTLMSILPVSILHNSESGRYRPIVADLEL